jgi:hypothetical protein
MEATQQQIASNEGGSSQRRAEQNLSHKRPPTGSFVGLDSCQVATQSERGIASPYLTTEQAVAYTHTSAKTLRRAELSGGLPSFRPGKVKLYRITDLDNWVISKAIEPDVTEQFSRPKLSDLLASSSLGAA